jgi:hypothetical protein
MTITITSGSKILTTNSCIGGSATNTKVAHYQLIASYFLPIRNTAKATRTSLCISRATTPLTEDNWVFEKK